MKRLFLIILLAALLLPGAVEAASATLSWTDNSTNEMGFNVQRKAEACAGTGAFSLLGQVAANVKVFVDTTVVEKGMYCYRVNAWNTTDGTPTGTVQVSGWSNAAGVTIPLAVPVDPSLLGVTSGP